MRTRKWELPATLPGGDMMPYMSARYRTQMIDALFEGTGGFERAKAWIEESSANYGEFFIKVWSKGAIRSTQVEERKPEEVEELLARLDAGEHAKVINAEADKEVA